MMVSVTAPCIELGLNACDVSIICMARTCMAGTCMALPCRKVYAGGRRRECDRGTGKSGAVSNRTLVRICAFGAGVLRKRVHCPRFGRIRPIDAAADGIVVHRKARSWPQPLDRK